MKKITITIKTVNAAFEDNENELADILSEFSMDLRNGIERKSLRDINGNKVGFVEYE